MSPFKKRALFMIGIASELARVHPQTLRIYERKGLLKPQRSARNTRLYSQEDIERLERINQLTNDGVNLIGIQKILKLEQKIQGLIDELRLSSAGIDELKKRHLREIDNVHKSYRKEVAIRPKGEIQMIITRRKI